MKLLAVLCLAVFSSFSFAVEPPPCDAVIAANGYGQRNEIDLSGFRNNGIPLNDTLLGPVVENVVENVVETPVERPIPVATLVPEPAPVVAQPVTPRLTWRERLSGLFPLPMPFFGPPNVPAEIPVATLVEPPRAQPPADSGPILVPMEETPGVEVIPPDERVELAMYREELAAAPRVSGMEIPNRSLCEATRRTPRALPYFVLRSRDAAQITQRFFRREQIRAGVLATLDERLSAVGGQGILATTLPERLASVAAASDHELDGGRGLRHLAVGMSLRLRSQPVVIPEARALTLIRENAQLTTDASRNRIDLRLQEIFSRHTPVTVTEGPGAAWTVSIAETAPTVHYEVTSIDSLVERITTLQRVFGPTASFRGSLSVALPLHGISAGRVGNIARVLQALLTLDQAAHLAEHASALRVVVEELQPGGGAHTPYPSNVLRIENFDSAVPNSLERARLLLAYGISLATPTRERRVFAPEGTSLLEAVRWAAVAFGRFGERESDDASLRDYATWRSRMFERLAALVELFPESAEVRRELRSFLNVHAGLDIPSRVLRPR